MRLSPKELDVQAGDAFKGDLFNRNEFGQRLKNIVKNIDGSLVVALDSPWGLGKSTFVKMWQGQLRSEGIESIYVDSFKTDYFEDPFLAIAGSINEFVEQANLNDDLIKDEFIDRAKKVGVGLLGFSLKVAVKAATLGVLDKDSFDALDKVASDIAQGASDAAENIVKDKLKSYSGEMSCINAFREILSKIPTMVIDNESNKLVVIVDELDRCRPNYAVEFLERIKHFFSVDNVVFVLVVNKSQLLTSLRKVYGDDLDANGYLHRFIDLTVELPSIKWESVSRNGYLPYVASLSEEYGIELESDYQIALAMYFYGFNVSLRNMSRVFSLLVILKLQLSEQYFRFYDYVIIFSLIRIEFPVLFERLRSGKADIQEVFGSLEFENRKSFKDWDVTFLKNSIRYLMVDESTYRQQKDDFKLHDNHFYRSRRLNIIYDYLDAVAFVA